MRYTKGSIKINNDLNRIDKELNNNKNVGKNITILENYLNQPYFKTRVKKILFKGYMQIRKIDKAYNLIKELYESTKEETALMDLVKLLLDSGLVDKAKEYVNDACIVVPDPEKKSIIISPSFTNPYLSNLWIKVDGLG